MLQAVRVQRALSGVHLLKRFRHPNTRPTDETVEIKPEQELISRELLSPIKSIRNVTLGKIELVSPDLFLNPSWYLSNQED